ncbi:efflux RND transporter periplasmic adaptor subunit [Nostoc sp. C117]|uniref:efflux RND transporter periplasmic adaptor subunit n=1 Tax=Nostoc sp. C117 TaxID=3349875 RepID=UPI00370D8B1C
MTSPEPQTDFEENSSETSFEQPPQKRRWLWLFLAALLLLGGGAAIVWRLLTPQNSAPSTANVQPQGVRVKISTVQSGIIEESSDFIASLESQRSVNLTSRIQGQVTQIFVKLGDSVAQGAAIIQVDARRQQGAPNGINAAPQAFLMQLENARATLKSLEAERPSYVSNVQLSQAEYEKYFSLAQQGAVSRQASNQYANRLTAAKTSLNAIDSRIQAQQGTILQAEKSLQQANINTSQQPQIQYDKITAPFGGTVGEISVKVGDFVNTSTQLVTVMQNRPLEVKISVPVQRRPLLRQGMPVEIMNTQGQKLGRTRIFSIAPNASNETQGILIKALFNNSNGQVRANQLARARLIWNERPGILIPTAAVTRVGGQTFVYVVETEKSPQGVSEQVARQRRIKLGEIKGNNYQVMEGLQPQDQIIISGLLNLTDGVAIVPDF